ncbi:PREDICTED: uncharacterized protein LOC109222065 [Nicotiana attenuata]|uniref:uncharacterized protein LOC109222065 n=1 Tax=Nicotiana attenuata TaxID=49451 RepID=UPI00090546C5|nr:PREDICTED: uncharacterized protein LOC109222065 [Nicotiana attenuata]
MQNCPNDTLNSYCKGGKFCIEKLYKASRPQYQKCNWKRSVTTSKAIPRHQFILWLALHRRLTAVERQQKWGIAVNKDCVICSRGTEETFQHLLSECTYSRNMWNAMLNWIEIQHQIGSWDEEIEWITKVVVNRTKGEILVFLFTAVVYQIWKERNNRRFQGIETTYNKSIKEIVLMLHIRGQQVDKWRKELEKLNSYPS